MQFTAKNNISASENNFINPTVFLDFVFTHFKPILFYWQIIFVILSIYFEKKAFQNRLKM